MQAIKSKGTKIEILLGKALWAKGYRYRKNDKSVKGKPDFTFKKLKIAIFCDSEFWHGKDFESIEKRIGTNRQFWIDKIKKNIMRDIEINKELTSEGWTVIRFWEKEIKKSLESCISKIEEILQTRS